MFSGNLSLSKSLLIAFLALNSIMLFAQSLPKKLEADLEEISFQFQTGDYDAI